MTDAQLYWDDTDWGWWFRYTDAAGVQHERGIDAAPDAVLSELAGELPSGLPRGRVSVYRHGEARLGLIWLNSDGIDWRYD